MLNDFLCPIKLLEFLPRARGTAMQKMYRRNRYDCTIHGKLKGTTRGFMKVQCEIDYIVPQL